MKEMPNEMAKVSVKLDYKVTILFDEMLKLVKKQEEIASLNKQTGRLESIKLLCAIFGYGILPISIIFPIYGMDILLVPWLASALFILYARRVFARKVNTLERDINAILEEIKPIEEKIEEFRRPLIYAESQTHPHL